jgi:hypothetical protein
LIQAGLGGHMNMENFITGFPGHEHEHRAAMLEVLGQEKYEFFFDKVNPVNTLIVFLLTTLHSSLTIFSLHPMQNSLQNRD